MLVPQNLQGTDSVFWLSCVTCSLLQFGHVLVSFNILLIIAYKCIIIHLHSYRTTLRFRFVFPVYRYIKNIVNEKEYPLQKHVHFFPH